MPSPVQDKILAFIRGYLDKRHMPPTMREIQDHCGFSAIGTIQYHLKNLAQAGYVEIKPRLSRGIILRDRAIGIPIIGRVPAGPTQLAFEHVEGYISSIQEEPRQAPPEIRSQPFSAPGPSVSDPRGLFALRVRGDSMTGAGILDNDLVIVRPQSSAKNGDIVVARIHQEEVTVKKLVRKPGLIQLAPENPKYKAIPVDEDTEIIGKVIRVVRHYT